MHIWIADDFLIGESIAWCRATWLIEKVDRSIVDSSGDQRTTLIEKYDTTNSLKKRRSNIIHNAQMFAIDHKKKVRIETNEIVIILESDYHRARFTQISLTH